MERTVDGIIEKYDLDKIIVIVPWGDVVSSIYLMGINNWYRFKKIFLGIKLVFNLHQVNYTHLGNSFPL